MNSIANWWRNSIAAFWIRVLLVSTMIFVCLCVAGALLALALTYLPILVIFGAIVFVAIVLIVASWAH